MVWARQCRVGRYYLAAGAIVAVAGQDEVPAASVRPSDIIESIGTNSIRAAGTPGGPPAGGGPHVPIAPPR